MIKFFAFLLVLLTVRVNCNGITIDVASKYRTINYRTIDLAIKQAQATFVRSPNSVVTIKIRAGKYHLYPPSSKPIAINFTGQQPGPKGRLIFEGAGRSSTVIVVPKGFTIIRGRNIYRLTIRHLTLTRDQPLVSQGRVIQTGKGFITLQLPKGFPDVMTIYDRDWWQGRYLRKYSYVNGRCNLLVNDNPQIAYSRIENLGGGKYKFILSEHYRNSHVRWKHGQMVGVKSKCCNDYGRNLYWFCGGSDIVLEHLRFMRSSRGVMRCGMSNIRISDVLISKDNAGWCLATSGGGPQIGQPDDKPIYNVIIDHLVSDGTGDDSVALFNVKSGVVKNCNIKNSFARGILLNNSPNVRVYGNKLVRNPIVRCKKSPCPES